MTDFDALIDALVEWAQECENEHEWRGNIKEKNELGFKEARSALREAIASLQWDYDEAMLQYNNAQKRACDAEARVAALEAELKEADADAERLDEMLGEMVDVHGKSYGDVQDARDLHVARLSKRGQG